MKCHVPGQNVKILARAIHALARFGDDLFVESQPDCLLLRTLNSAESAYAVVKFNKRFFSHFNHDYYATEDDSGLKCKISMRSALNVFKSPAQLDKQVENLEMKLEAEACKLIFQLHCRHGVLKTHYVHILDCKAMQAVFTTDNVPNKIMANQRVLIGALNNFQSSDDYVTLEVSPQTFLLRNYIDDNVDFSKLIRTQINIRPVEFESFVITLDTQISFSLKEFRALLIFAEALNLPIQLNLETEGKPVVFIVHNSSTFEATFVLATTKSDVETNTTQGTTCDVRNKRSSEAGGGSARKKQHTDDIAKTLDEDSHLFNFVDLPDENINNNQASKKSNVTNDNSKAIVFEKDVNVNKDNETITRDVVRENDRNVVMEELEIAASPAAHSKVRTLFKRCFDATMDFRSQHVILAENSDSE